LESAIIIFLTSWTAAVLATADSIALAYLQPIETILPPSYPKFAFKPLSKAGINFIAKNGGGFGASLEKKARRSAA
jgi:hypothetical protein